MMDARPNLLTRPLAPALFAAGFALLVHSIHIYFLRGSVLFDAPIMDAAVHDGWARGEIDFFYRGIAYFRAPLYMWFLQAVYALNDGYLAPRIAQALLAAMTVGFVADMGRRLAGALAGLAAGVLLALTWPVIYFAGELLIVTFFMALVVLALWFFVRAGMEDRRLWALLGAATLGVSSLARPASLAFLPMLVAMPLWVWPSESCPRLRSRPWLFSGVLLLLALLPGIALTVRNFAVAEDPVFIASQGGVNFYIGNNAESDGRTAVVPGTSGTWMGGYQDTIRKARQAEGRVLKGSEVSRYYFREGLRYLKEQPGDALRLYARKLRLLLGAAERSNNQNLHWWRAQNAFLRLPIFLSWATILSLSLVGWWLLPQRRRAAPVAGFLVLYALGLLAFFINERFRTPLTIVLATTAGIPIAHAWQAAREGRWRALGTLLVLILIPYVACSMDRVGYKGDRLDADAFSRYTTGNAYLKRGDAETALRYYRDAQSVAQKFGLKHFEPVDFRLRLQKGRAYARLKKDELMDAELIELERSAPDNPEVISLRGSYHVVRWEFYKASGYFERAIAAMPRLAEAHEGLGWVYLDQRNYAKSQEQFRQAFRIDPKLWNAYVGLGVCEAWERRDFNQARAKFDLALQHDWNLPWAHRLLGEFYRLERNIPLMIYHTRECVRLDPYNREARRLLQRGGIDPEHPPGTKYPYGP